MGMKLNSMEVADDNKAIIMKGPKCIEMTGPKCIGLNGTECIERIVPSNTKESPDEKDSPWRLFKRTVRHFVNQVNQRHYKARGKRILDLCGGCLLLVLVIPVFCITWIVVMLTSRGPAIFSQERIGFHGKRFRFYKFRSMYVDQDTRIDTEEIKRGESVGLLYKPDYDSRVTPVGRFIRKTSIDELPQLWNVIRGDMSLVGPRPLVPHMLKPYPEILNHRSKVRPGLTGLWQISARHDNNSVLGMVKYDDDYVNNYSMLTDLSILLKTPLVVINTNGAK